jgi:fatty acid desaturase
LKFIFQDLSLRSLVEIFFMLVHFVLLFGFSIIFLPLAVAMAFQLVVFLTMGVYMGLIFAPNHKGEDMLEAEAAYNWVHQITLTRNIKPGLFTSYFLGGLEHQIEHHLFPTMPRYRYEDARVLVRNFCQEQNIPYHETTWLESLRQIHYSLLEESRAWRQS